MSHSSERHWYVVYSKPQKEVYAQFHLRLKGVETFFPQLLVPNASRSRRRIIPLFPNYLFVRLEITSPEYFYVTWSPGVRRIVSFNGCPASIDEQIVDFFMRQADEEGIIRARSNLKTGQEVRITGGPLGGLVGVLQEPPDGKGRVKILLNLLNRQTNVEVPLQFIETGWVASASISAI
jgi:transcriptional antiterminator RfaH